jgi:hypothetical protein
VSTSGWLLVVYMQLWKGAAACAVVSDEHSGVEEMMGIVMGFTKEPG